MADSPQEEIIHNLSKYLLGNQYLFIPAIYGPKHKQRRTIDIAWICGRCAIIMFLTKTNKGTYARKRKHNLDQLKRWMHVWKRGIPLAMANGEALRTFNYEQIDHVVGLSIVEGGEVWCEYHADRVLNWTDNKLSACATITADVFRMLTSCLGGPRDLIHALTVLHEAPTSLVSEHDLIHLIRTVHRTELHGFMSK